jgi:hypothetical protein
VADGHHPDTAGEVDDGIAVGVMDERALGAVYGDVGGTGKAAGQRSGTARGKSARLGTG